MKVAILSFENWGMTDLQENLPKDTTQLLIRGNTELDRYVKAYAQEHKMELIEFEPDFEEDGPLASLKSIHRMVEEADTLLLFLDGKGFRIQYIADYAKEMGKEVQAILLK